MMKTAILATALVGLSSAALAVDCSSPPYGDTPNRYAVFIQVYGGLLSRPEKMVAAVCRAKFEGGDRAALYQFNIGDTVIDGMSVTDVSVAFLDAIRRQVRRESGLSQ